MLAIPPPKQVRSTRTQDAFIRAFESLLEQNEFDRISVAEIAKAANRSVGSFYTRFKDKEDLLAAVRRQYGDERERMGESDFSLESFRGLSLEETVRNIVTRTVREYRRRAGLFRALEEAHRKGSKTEERSQMVVLYDAICQILLQFEREIAGPDRELRARMAFFNMIVTCKGLILYPNDSHASTIRVSDAQLVEECTSAFLAYLTYRTEGDKR